ncbi:MAG: hypothetical protein S4CHLAM6_08250 [Chlamydiae bacterium]|nr:hypothetical protein [Chlamydiota bacterium]
MTTIATARDVSIQESTIPLVSPTTIAEVGNDRTFPVVINSQAGLQGALKDQLGLQLAVLFQDLFPISQDFEQETAVITSQQILESRSSVLIDDVLAIKMSILTINQVVNLAASRIPSGFTIGGPQTAAPTIAGLDAVPNLNPVLQTVNNLYLDIINGAFETAQSDYATLRDQLRPNLNI